MNFLLNYTICAVTVIFSTVLLYPASASAFVQSVNPGKDSLVLSADADTVLTAESGYIRISLMDNSYLLLEPGASINIRAVDSADQSVDIRAELLRGVLLIQALNTREGSLRLLVDEILLTMDSATAGIDKRGFYWVESGQVQITSLSTGSQVTIRKGMYAQSNNSAGDILSGKLSMSEMQHLSTTYKPNSETSVYREYKLEYVESGELVLRELSGVLPVQNQ